jgi:hypothetical protein
MFDALLLSPYMIQAIDPTFTGGSDIRVLDGSATLPRLQEFFHYSRPFWDSHPKAWTWLKRLVAHHDVRDACTRYHRALAETYGRGFKKPAFVAGFDIEADKAKAALKQALAASSEMLPA